MTKRLPKSPKSVAVLPTDYAPLLAEIKARIRTAQVKAALAANAELVLLYWQMGQRIAEMQVKEGWGAGVIPRLAADLHAEFPEMRGFSERNIGRMIGFFQEYPALFSILPQAVAKLPNTELVQQPAALLPASPEPSSRKAIVPQASAQLGPAEILQQTVAKLTPGAPIAILPQLAALLSWNFKAVGLFESVRSVMHKALMDKYFLFKLKPSA